MLKIWSMVNIPSILALFLLLACHLSSSTQARREPERDGNQLTAPQETTTTKSRVRGRSSREEEKEGHSRSAASSTRYLPTPSPQSKSNTNDKSIDKRPPRTNPRLNNENELPKPRRHPKLHLDNRTRRGPVQRRRVHVYLQREPELSA